VLDRFAPVHCNELALNMRREHCHSFTKFRIGTSRFICIIMQETATGTWATSDLFTSLQSTSLNSILISFRG